MHFLSKDGPGLSACLFHSHCYPHRKVTGGQVKYLFDFPLATLDDERT